MKRVLVIALLLGACVAESESPPVVTIHTDAEEALPTDNTAACTAAEALPAEDPCSLICDPDAFKARLVDDGMAGGACYQLRCTLTVDMAVTVGVCLP